MSNESISVTNPLRRMCAIIEDNVYGTSYYKLREFKDEITNEVETFYDIHIENEFIDWYTEHLLTPKELETISQKQEQELIKEILDEYEKDILRGFFKYDRKGKEEK